jgi:hypothetical protein
MSIDATPGTGRFSVAPAVSAPERVVPPPARPAGPPPAARRPPAQRDLGGWEVSGRVQVLLASMGLAVIVFASLLLVSLAAARPGILVPSAKRGDYPSWLAGPTGVLTNWFVASAHTERVLFTAAIATMLVAYLVVAWVAPRLRATWVLGAIVLVHVIFVLAPPLSLSDVFNYLNYGRMEAVYHLNPYTTIPALEPHSDPTFVLSNWHGLLSPYGPLFTVFTMAIAPLGVAGSFWAMKIALMLASLGTVFLAYRCAGLLGRAPLTAAVVIGINPIVLVWGLGGDHNDFLMIFFLVLSFWLLLRANALRIGRRPRLETRRRSAPASELRRLWAWIDGMPRPLVVGEPAAWMEFAAGVALVAAVAIKASSAVLVPIVLAGAARRVRVASGVAVGLVAASVMTVIAFGVNLPNIGQQDRLVIPDGIPNLLGLALGFGGYTTSMRSVFTLLLIAVVVGASAWAWRTRRWLTACGVATVALLLTLGWTLPWYILWILPFAALSRSRWVKIAAAALCVYIYLAWMPYSSEVLGFLHINPATTNLGAQETSFMNNLLF